MDGAGIDPIGHTDAGVSEREAALARSFVQLADTLVDDFDIIDLLTVLADRSVELLAVDAAGVLLADTDGHLRVMAASEERVRLVELFQLQNDEGPCLDAFGAAHPVSHPDLATADAGERWPRFSAHAVDAGYHAVVAIPMRLRSTVIGALNLFRVRPGEMSDHDVIVAQALADVASIALIQDRSLRDAASMARHHRHALDSRVVIEQAKGMLAERGGVAMDVAFERLRHFARDRRRRIAEVAEDLVTGNVALDLVLLVDATASD